MVPCTEVYSQCAAAVAMNEIMKTQVELALQNRQMSAPSQPEPAVTTTVAAAERSKAEKLQDAMEAEARRRSQQQIHDDRKRKFNSLDGDAKEVTGDFIACKLTFIPFWGTLFREMTSCAEEDMEAYRMHNQRSFDPMAAFLGGDGDVSAAET